MSGVTVVQHTNYFANNGTPSGSKAFVTNPTAGSALICAIASGVSASDVPAISDNVNGSWGAALTSVSLTVDHDNILLFCFPNCAGGATTVTATIGASGTVQFQIIEVSGLDPSAPFDTSTTAYNAATTTLTTGAITPATANALILGVMGTSTNEPTPTTSGGASLLESTQNLATSALVVTGGGAQTVGFTMINGTTELGIIAASFKAPAGAITPGAGGASLSGNAGSLIRGSVLIPLVARSHREPCSARRRGRIVVPDRGFLVPEHIARGETIARLSIDHAAAQVARV